MSEYSRDKGSIDLTISEINNGEHRVKIIGIVVTKTSNFIIIGDATGQVKVSLSRYQKEIDTKSKGRFILNIIKNENGLSGELLSFISMTKDQISNYRRIIEFEKRIPR